MMKNYDLWSGTLENICSKAFSIKVKDIMYTPDDGEYVEADCTLDEAVHQLIIGHHQSLLVTSKNKVIGIIRLTDVFSFFADELMGCD